MTTHLIQWSTGIGSAEVSRRVAEEYGRENVHLLTADPLVEDEDNWRFAHEVVAYLGLEDAWTILTDGRTPMQVGRDMRVVPNNRLAVCSRVLKREILRSHIEDNYDPVDTVIHLGFDWTEQHRLKASIEPWKPWTIDAVLTRPPYAHKAMLLDEWRARGIEPPRLYEAGFSHANCGGACVRGGQAQWERLLRWNRDRYLEWETEEEKTRAELGKDVAILRARSEEHVLAALGLTAADIVREEVAGTAMVEIPTEDDDYAFFPDQPGPTKTTVTKVAATGEQLPTSVPLTLRAFRERLDAHPAFFDESDEGACGCFMGEDS